MNGKIDFQTFYDIQKEVTEADLPRYAFVDRYITEGGPASIYHKRKVLIYLKEQSIFWISPDEDVKCVPLSKVKKLFLRTDISDTGVLCSVFSSGSRPLVFGDHSYCIGAYNVAEVSRYQFRVFIEEVQAALETNGLSESVTFEARGPMRRGSGFYSLFIIFGMSPILITSLSVYWPSKQVDDKNCLGLTLTILLIVLCVSFFVFFRKIMSPRIIFERTHTPESVFDLTDAIITKKCHRHASSIQVSESMPFLERACQYTDIRGRHCCYQLTDKEIVFTIQKNNVIIEKTHYPLDEIRRVNLNNRRINYYIVSIMFNNGKMLRITPRNCSFSDSHRPTKEGICLIRLLQWIHCFHKKLCDTGLEKNIEFTSGSTILYWSTRIIFVVFNIFVGAFIIFFLAQPDLTIKGLIGAFGFGVVTFFADLMLIGFDTTSPKKFYSPESVLEEHIP